MRVSLFALSIKFLIVFQELVTVLTSKLIKRLLMMLVVEFLVFREMVNFYDTINYLATQMNNETSFKPHKERFIIVAGIKKWEWENIPFVLLVSLLVLGL